MRKELVGYAVTAAVFLLGSTCAIAIEPGRSIAQVNHTVWTAHDAEDQA